MEDTTRPPVPPRAGLFRTLASLLYDGIAVVAIWMVATLLVLPLTGGEAVPSGQIGYRILLLALAGCYYIWSWLTVGQTLGMRAWRLRLVSADGRPPGLGQAALRIPAACLSAASAGLGYVWILVPPEHLSWHDRLSGTRLVRVPRRAETAQR